MSLLSIAKLPLSVDEGWPELARLNPGIPKIFLLLVFPMSLLPPAMLYFAGTHYPEVLGQAALAKDWAEVATIFFLAEWGTYLLMGWLVKQVGTTWALKIGYRDAYLLAAISAMPLWLSSVGLFVPNLAFNALLSTAALGLSCLLLYQGLQALGRTRDEVVAGRIAQLVIGAGLIGWALLLVLALL